MLPYVVIAIYHGYVHTDSWLIIRLKKITGDLLLLLTLIRWNIFGLTLYDYDQLNRQKSLWIQNASK